jgi:two-component system cell cycle sensor histidine kinase/response regulator CckA
MKMNNILRVLIIEDSEDDTLSLVRELKRLNYEIQYDRVYTESELKTALNQQWDVVLSDYSMPNFNGMEALKIVREKDHDLPFIFISGTLDEDQAVLAMKSGANDYIFKGNLKRLIPAIERSLADAKIKKERNIYESQFFQAQKMESLGQLIGGIAHDFNNLLMIIQGNLDILRVDLSGDEEHTQQIDHALESTHACADLIKRLMVFSKLQLLKPDLLKLQDIIPRVIQLLTSVLGARIQFKCQVSEDIWNVLLDEGQFESALVHLAINARDAMKGNGLITIEVNNIAIEHPATNANDIESGDYVKISIIDTGCGIPAEHIDRVFEPFFTTKEVGKGSGLGLSMVYGIVKQSDGYTRYTSRCEQG